MRREVGAFLVAGLLLGASAGAEPPEKRNGIAEWLKRNGISIRKAIDGSRNESRPAAVTWVDDSTKDGQFYLVDLAVKLRERELVKVGDGSFLLYPAVEWHKSTQSGRKADQLSGSLRFEYRPFALAGYSPENQRLPPLFPGQVLRAVSPLILGSIKYSEDLVRKDDEIGGSVFLSLTSNKRGFPGAAFRSADGAFRGRYYPYVGLERFEPALDGTKAGVEFLTARLYFEVYPVTSLTRQYMQVVFEYAYRDRIGGEGFSGKSASELSLSLNLYLDDHGHLAIGYEYVKGEDPRNAFLDREISSVALKFRF